MDLEQKKEEAKYTGLTKRDDLIIHSIPKRFINSKKETEEHHKGMGVLILGLGAIIMLAGVALAYFFVFKKNPISQGEAPSAPKEQAQIISDEKTAESGASDNPGSRIDEKPLSGGSAESPVDGGASSSEMIGDSSGPLNQADSASGTAENYAESGAKIIEIETEPKNEEQTAARQPVLDSDNDGLSDKEEAVLGANVNLPDSDGDTYGDLRELLNLFNPAGEGKIINNDQVTAYANNKYNYTLYYPRIWKLDSTNSGETAVFKIDDNLFIQVIAAGNLENQTIEEWYKSQFETNQIGPDQVIYKKGWQGIKSADKTVCYLNNYSNKTVFAINYSVGAGQAVDFYNIFEMMVNSFELQNSGN